MVSRRDVLKIMVSGVLGLAIGGVGGYFSRQSEIDSLRKEIEDAEKWLENLKQEQAKLENPEPYIYEDGQKKHNEASIA
ncbi:MAG: hypothetical protein QXE44_05980, partial [Nitrososphaerota archaeon]